MYLSLIKKLSISNIKITFFNPMLCFISYIDELASLIFYIFSIHRLILNKVNSSFKSYIEYIYKFFFSLSLTNSLELKNPI